MRILTRAGALSAVAAAALLSAPAAAHATVQATARGDNGTVKIHDAKTGEELRRNEPHVCTFYLDAFGFDAVQQVDWHIEAWAPTAHSKGETVKTGAITLDAEGDGRTENLTLPDGHYKLFWNFDGEKGAAKHKVFWTDCGGSAGGGGTTPAPSASTPGSGSSSPAAETSSPAASPSGSAGGAPAASSSPSAQGGSGSGNLAETGNSAPVVLLSGLAATLVAGGGYLVARRRRA
jgi:LPXTG-motif cell wall-anchored protein